ncbi:MAG: NAD(+)/NADH kinase [Thaumarchaeota archaeon]|nr:NAD(+)/NADH kinase [Nitrososphaerota archaeon]
MKLKKVGIITKFGSIESENVAEKIVKKLSKMNTLVYTTTPIKKTIKIESIDELQNKKLDMVITLGGDGTTLRTFRHLQNEIPILTINVGGNRGILSEIREEQIDQALQQIVTNNVFLDKRLRIVAECSGREFPPALNEIYINRKNLTKTSEFTIRFQNDTVKQKMDGVIIATPSGSTGHSFSLGGPILHESLNTLIITPVAPVYGLESIVVPAKKIQVDCSHDCNIVMDAQVIKSARFDESIIIKKYNKQAVFIRLKKRGLRQMNKLGF